MKESLPLTVGGTSGESNIANLWKDNFSAIANSVGFTDNRDHVMKALRTVPAHNDVIRYRAIGWESCFQDKKKNQRTNKKHVYLKNKRSEHLKSSSSVLFLEK